LALEFDAKAESTKMHHQPAQGMLPKSNLSFVSASKSLLVVPWWFLELIGDAEE
jgi:hypothetical protein